MTVRASAVDLLEETRARRQGLGHSVQRASMSQPQELDTTRALIRRLAEAAMQGEQLTEMHMGPGEDEVLLDCEVDGLRCLLIRQQRFIASDQMRCALSPREHEIARMVAQGYPNKTIASVLEISSFTVSTHLRRIFAKLGVTSRAAMVAQLIEGGVIHFRGAYRPAPVRPL